MTTLKFMDDFDILFHDFFRPQTNFFPLNTSNTGQVKLSHPINIYYNSKGLNFEVACTGLTKDDVEVNIEDGSIQIKYDKKPPKEDDSFVGIHNGLSRKSFDFMYKISSKFDLEAADAKLENGLLHIVIPIAEAAKPKQLKIK
jgi:HSP20 family protein